MIAFILYFTMRAMFTMTRSISMNSMRYATSHPLMRFMHPMALSITVTSLPPRHSTPLSFVPMAPINMFLLALLHLFPYHPPYLLTTLFLPRINGLTQLHPRKPTSSPLTTNPCGILTMLRPSPHVMMSHSSTTYNHVSLSLLVLLIKKK